MRAEELEHRGRKLRTTQSRDVIRAGDHRQVPAPQKPAYGGDVGLHRLGLIAAVDEQNGRLAALQLRAGNRKFSKASSGRGERFDIFAGVEIVRDGFGLFRRGSRLVLRRHGQDVGTEVFPVVDGYSLKLTTARWFTPKGRSIARDSTSGGITPDVVVAYSAALPRAMQLLQGVTTPADLRARVPRKK